MARARPRRKNTLIRQLALAKLRELKRQGVSYREIGQRFGRTRRPAHSPVRRRDPGREAARFLTAHRDAPTAAADEDAQIFLRALDALDQGLAFFTADGALLNTNLALARRLESQVNGPQLRSELATFADSLWRLVRLRGITEEASVEELIVQMVPLEGKALQLKGNYIGLDLFGRGPTVLVVLDCPPEDPLSDSALRDRFGLTPQECRIARHMASGSSNADIAEEAMISPHTVRRHTEHILRKLGARSRTEATYRIFRESED